MCRGPLPRRLPSNRSVAGCSVRVSTKLAGQRREEERRRGEPRGCIRGELEGMLNRMVAARRTEEGFRARLLHQPRDHGPVQHPTVWAGGKAAQSAKGRSP